ncbi:hypothetical protein FQR65_LT13713 [Abscondita terminalis]|nr:hypothetical protein FQR65_LT13713 [Abscondita terminalis]
MKPLKAIIEKAYQNINEINAETIDDTSKSAILEVIQQLDKGKLRVAEKQHDQCQNELFNAGYTHYFDKIPPKFSHFDKQQFQHQGLRVVPNACVRQGSYIGKNTILMPSFVNIGAYIDEGSMIDSWATVGSCAQIGKHVHLSGGVGIGGVLEPLQAKPTIIEDHCFIGARSEVVEGVVIEENSVIGMGVFIGSNTPIYNRKTEEIIYGRVPKGSVVLAGSLPSKTGHCHLNCAIIIKQIDDRTRAKVAINELLRDS